MISLPIIADTCAWLATESVSVSRQCSRTSADMNNASGSEMNRKRVKKRYAVIYLLTDPTGKSKPGTSLKLSKGHHLRIMGGSAKTFWGAVMSCNHDIYLGHCDVNGAKDRVRVYELFNLLLFVPQLIDPRHEVVFLLTLLIFYPAAVTESRFRLGLTLICTLLFRLCGHITATHQRARLCIAFLSLLRNVHQSYLLRKCAAH